MLAISLIHAAITPLNNQDNNQMVFLPQVTTMVLFEIGGNSTENYSLTVDAALQGRPMHRFHSNGKKQEDLGGIFATAENRTMNNKLILAVLLYSTDETMEHLVTLVNQNDFCTVSPYNSFDILYWN